ncbi:hypothetical protein CEQ21_03845 [Niallia circulans]|uniref:Uncharacterized protein n=1 Tax=Niallia circulans TaxID=1397 RepID=A0A553ST02_NIACI|nr:hypothetical protein [Niallia circulans]TRZ40081.1 hypothetical protein CEQ21_03845 [Niallia circulans]
MRKFSIFLFILSTILLNACNGQTDNITYAMIVVVNNKEYNGTETVKDEGIKMGERIGEIEKETPVDVMPENNQSNSFEVGSKIYSVQGTDQYIIVLDKDNEEHLLERAPSDE